MRGGRVLAVLAGAVALVTTLDVLAGGWLRDFDGWVFRDGLPPRSGGWHLFWRTVVWGGQYWLVASLAGLAGAWRAYRERSPWPLLRTGAWLLAVELSLRAFQVAVGRTPPLRHTDTLYAGALSYPSGHAANSAACLLFVAGVLAASRPVVIGTHVLVAAVGVATVALGYHWPTDALAGWGLGVVLAYAGVALVEYRRRVPEASVTLR